MRRSHRIQSMHLSRIPVAHCPYKRLLAARDQIAQLPIGISDGLLATSFNRGVDEPGMPNHGPSACYPNVYNQALYPFAGILASRAHDSVRIVPVREKGSVLQAQQRQEARLCRAQSSMRL